MIEEPENLELFEPAAILAEDEGPAELSAGPIEVLNDGNDDNSDGGAGAGNDRNDRAADGADGRTIGSPDGTSDGNGGRSAGNGGASAADGGSGGGSGISDDGSNDSNEGRNEVGNVGDVSAAPGRAGRKRGRPRNGSGRNRAAGAGNGGSGGGSSETVDLGLDNLGDPEPVDFQEEIGKLTKSEKIKAIALIIEGLFKVPAYFLKSDLWELSPKEATDLAKAVSDVLDTLPKTQSKKLDKLLKEYSPYINLLTISFAIVYPRILIQNGTFANATGGGGAGINDSSGPRNNTGPASGNGLDFGSFEASGRDGDSAAQDGFNVGQATFGRLIG